MAAPRNCVVIGASAGGFQALSAFLGQLPAEFPGAIAVVLHRSPEGPSSLAPLLGRHACLPVSEPADGEEVRRGHVYIAPRDLHLELRLDRFHLQRGPKQHHTRPAIDALFYSAARAYGSRVIGVLMTGYLSDGVAGLVQIKAEGGLSLVQDPEDAAYPSMPRNAIMHDHVDLVFPLRSLPALLEELVVGKSVSAAARASGARPVAPLAAGQ
jgi:two-component system chemotaxis response regulator CheB